MIATAWSPVGLGVFSAVHRAPFSGRRLLSSVGEQRSVNSGRGRKENAVIPALPPFLAGIVLAPLVKRIAKPTARGVVKTSVGIAAGAKKVTHEVGEEFDDLRAEVAAGSIVSEDGAVQKSGKGGKVLGSGNPGTAVVAARKGSDS
ncbi:DUF5132 domain-containing protein [Streptomyces oryzae]|uniref:DUF5132 domain-containing protein n=1 Tax=Streptomyces oryzae TaxID=1434886 RepID=A0ABS3XIT7_9ACTN|nr:DUF5132 domain-containing protein [Streptomyces oryzae]MBO8195313.1 DUF5132 domain-containing protein [Streptomyces oryzae]